MTSSGVEVISMWPLGRSTDPSSDGTSSISSQMAMGGVAGGRPVVPPDSRAFSELLGSRLRTEDALQVTLEHMFQKIADQEKIIGQLQQTVSDLETSHQPWPKADFISLTERVAKMDVRLDTLPPDAALVTKMYLKEYDNQWVKKWQAMEEETGSRFDRLENRLASFEENVLRVELKIEHDMKQCLTELRRCVVRLDEVEQNSQEAMRLGFERVERDVTDITLKLKEEGDRLSRQENAHAKTADRLVEVIIQAEETRERISAAGAGLKGIRKDLQEVTDELGVRFALEVETINKTMSEAAERLVAVTSAAQATQTELATTKEELSAVQTAMERQQLAIQAQQQSLAELRTATQSNTAAAIKEAAKTAPGAAAVASAAGSAATSNMAEPGSSPSTTGGDEPFSSPWAAAPATYVPAHQRSPSDILQALANDGEHRAILKKTIEQELNATLKKAFEEKIVELKDEVESAMGRLAFSLQQLQASVSQKGRVLDDLDVRVKAATNANSMMHSEVDLLLKNMLLREEQDRWRDLMDGFAKDLDFFKRKYTRHLGLQVENYTVAGMAKEEDLSKLASDVQRKVSHDDLEKFLDRAVERAIQVYTTMQRNQAADEMVTAGSSRMVKSRCMACDRDMTMVTEGARPSLGSGLLTAGARSIAPSKVNFSKSKGFLPKINQGPSGPSGPGLNPMEMERLKRLAGEWDPQRPKTSPETAMETTGQGEWTPRDDTRLPVAMG